MTPKEECTSCHHECCCDCYANQHASWLATSNSKETIMARDRLKKEDLDLVIVQSESRARQWRDWLDCSRGMDWTINETSVPLKECRSIGHDHVELHFEIAGQRDRHWVFEVYLERDVLNSLKNRGAQMPLSSAKEDSEVSDDTEVLSTTELKAVLFGGCSPPTEGQ